MAPIVNLRSQPFFDDKRRAFWMLHTMGWGFYLMLHMASALAGGFGFALWFPVIISAGTGYSITLLLSVVLHLLTDRNPILTWGGAVAAAAIAAALYSIIDVAVYSLLGVSGANFTGSTFLSAVTINVLLIAAWSALYYGINFYIIVEQQADQMIRLEAQASSAQLAMLRYQLNPHFLFNTLNSISTLVLMKENARANNMLVRLSSFLRYTLVNEPSSEVTLEQELNTLELYLDIEKMRFGERLSTRFTIHPMAVQALLPSMLLQPLVENAIKYAVSPSLEGARITIDARVIGDHVEIIVADTGAGEPELVVKKPISMGVGLTNTRERLLQAYGENQRFETLTNDDGGFSVYITLPFKKQHETEL